MIKYIQGTSYTVGVSVEVHKKINRVVFHLPRGMVGDQLMSFKATHEKEIERIVKNLKEGKFHEN